MKHFRERKQNCKVKKCQQHHSAFVVTVAIFCVVLGVLVLGTLFWVHQLILGKSTTIQGDDEGIYSPLAVFPSSDIDTASQDVSEISQEDVSKEITEDDILWLESYPDWDRMTATHHVMLYPTEPEKDYIFRIYEEDITDERHWSRERDEIAAIMEQSKSVYECPPVREGNIAFGEINAMHYFAYQDYSNDDYTDYFLIVSYLLDEEIVYDCRVYKGTAGGPILEREVTELLNEKYSHSEDPPAIQMELEIMELLRQE